MINKLELQNIETITTCICCCFIIIYSVYSIYFLAHILNNFILIIKNNIYYFAYNIIRSNNLYYFYSINIIYKNDSNLYCYECLICLELYNDKNIHLTNCKHEYCKYCFIKLLKYSYEKKHIHCPYCRNQIKYVITSQ